MGSRQHVGELVLVLQLGKFESGIHDRHHCIRHFVLTHPRPRAIAEPLADVLFEKLGDVQFGGLLLRAAHEKPPRFAVAFLP